MALYTYSDTVGNRMTEARRGGLSYGHLGDAVYDTDSRQWHFSRIPGITRSLQPVGRFFTSLKSSLLLPASEEPHSAANRNKFITDLVKSNPELVPSVSLLPSLAQASETITSTTSDYDSVKSDLLAFGTAADVNQRSGRRTVDIVAVAGGRSGEAVRFVRLNKEHLKWEGYTGVSLDSRTLSGADEGWWIGGGEPIQQLCFSETEGHPGAWLAARQSMTINIFRPLLRRTAVLAHYATPASSICADYKASRLDANPILRLDVSLTGGASYADVAFDPWYARRFAVIDRKGKWGIWSIEGQHGKMSVWSAIPGVNGNLGSELDLAIAEDGWAKILWVSTINTIVVASRKICQICQIKESPQHLGTLDLGLNGKSSWILDIKRSPQNQAHVFVITSSSLFWVLVNKDREEDSNESKWQSAKILLAWHHFRDQEDISLQIQICSRDEGLILLVLSRLTSLITAFSFALLGPRQQPTSVSDPFTVPLHNINSTPHDRPGQRVARLRKLAFSNLMLTPIECILPMQSCDREFETLDLNAGNSFYKLYVLYSDLSIGEQTYIFSTHGKAMASNPAFKASRLKVAKSSTMIADDDFIVPDGVPLEIGETSNQDSDGDDFALQSSPPNKTVGDPWTVKMEWLHHEIQNPNSSEASGEVQSPSRITFDESLEELAESVVQKLHLGREGIDTLLEMLPQEISIQDIDGASSSLLAFLDRVANELPAPETDIKRQIKMVPLFRSSLVSLVQGNVAEGDDILLLPIYENLMKHWISSLPAKVPGRTRVTIERSIRKIAIELCLASYGIQCRRAGKKLEDQVHRQSSTETMQLELPVRRKNSATGLPQKSKGKSREVSRSRDFSPQTSAVASNAASTGTLSANLPRPKATPSKRSSHSQTSNTSPEDPAIQRLRALVSFKSQAPLSNSMQTVLSHWKLGANPADYDYDYERAQTQASGTAAAGDDSQLKQRRRQEKKLKRQRQDTLGESSSQPVPPMVWGSQPQEATFLQPSSPASGVLMVQSQVEPGLHGGRGLGGKKMAAKKRKKGF